MTLMGNRFLTFNSVIRVNQIEVARDRSLGNDEAAWHTPESIESFRSAFEMGWPGGRMTWAFSWLALKDEREPYREIRKLVADYHNRYGDDVTFIPGAYFANAYNTREQVNRDLHEGLALASAVVGGGHRPKSVVAGFLAAENQRYLAEHEGIHVCQGNIWSQFAVDNQDGDGSISYPYYPSQEHFCKPAQGEKDFIDCVNLDGWTMDFVSARRAGGGWEHFNSRMGVGPLETLRLQGFEKGVRQMVETTAAHFDRGFELNGFAWVTNCWEAGLAHPKNPDYCRSDGLTEWLKEIRRRWPEAQSVTQGEFGLAWRDQFKDNAKLDYRFVQRGTGIFGSEENLEIRWFMNRDFRLALLRDWQANGPEKVIDLTRYDLPAAEPQGVTRKWSLMGKINMKGTRPQDKPVALGELAAEDQALIRRHYSELFKA